MTHSRLDPSSGAGASSSRTTTILSDVERYYSERLAEHGPTPRGVDWNGDESQVLRFRQLKKILPVEGPVSVNDLGCGYGGMLTHLQAERGAVDYHGCDVSPAMIETARRVHGEAPGTRFVVESAPSRVAEFGMASGVFNVRVGQDGTVWRDFMVEVLDVIDRTSQRGFAFNCLTSYSDADKMRDHLYYADPCDMFDLCKRRYSRNVALLHDYGLYEFTILIRKDA